MKKFTKKLNIKFKILLEKKKRKFYEADLTQKIDKPQELWKTLKFMGQLCTALTAPNFCLKNKNEILSVL